MSQLFGRTAERENRSGTPGKAQASSSARRLVRLRELKDQATEALIQGKFKRAAALYEAYCQCAPDDVQSLVRMGDALARAGWTRRAIASYHVAAQRFSKEGFDSRAIGAWKRLLELDPDDTAAQQFLATLEERKGRRGGSHLGVPG